MANPNPDFYETVKDYNSITEWAIEHGFTLEDALEAGVQSDDESDNIYVPRETYDQLA